MMDLWKNKKYRIVILGIVGLALLILPGLLSNREKRSDTSAVTDIEYYSDKIEEKLEELLAFANGVGNVRVVVTLDCSDETVYAQNTDVKGDGYSGEYVIIASDGEEGGVRVKEIYPKIRGVAVVCDGGDNIAVKKRVTELVSGALGISSGKIVVSG